ncbi:MAG: GNAT family N-acetyltransferase [Desulfovibrio sp.]|nr:GNAT family N-acetyltransferase [Desulfovibrio sp.]
MLAFATEPFAELEPEARPLTAAHWREVEAQLHGNTNYGLDAQRYAQLEKLGMLHVSAARTSNRNLAGYAAFTLVSCPHRQGMLLAALDGLYLAPQARGGFTALQLLRHAEAALKQRGAGLVQYSSPASRPCDALYRRLGAHHTETIWHKELR